MFRGMAWILQGFAAGVGVRPSAEGERMTPAPFPHATINGGYPQHSFENFGNDGASDERVVGTRSRPAVTKSLIA